MLLELHIKNFALIEDLEIQFEEGLNILSGETGAGKSILIDALSGILGERMTTDIIRTGADRSILEGVFDITKQMRIKKILDDSGIDCEDDVLFIRRVLHSTGKGQCFINSTQIPLSKLKEISNYLVDIHGQNEHHSITKISRHRELLDSFAGHNNLVEEINAIYKQLSDLQEKIALSEIDEKEKQRRIEYLNFAINEIKSANLSIDEDKNLKEESTILSNAEKLFAEINNASSLMNDDEGAIQKLKRIEHSLSAISDYDSKILQTLEGIKETLYTLEDASQFLKDYEKNIDFSPSRLDEVEKRLSIIQNLKKKYGNSIEEILEYLSNAKEELDGITSADEMMASLKEEYTNTIKDAKETALKLSQKRKLAAEKLEMGVMSELTDLGMPGAVFRISIKREISPDGLIESDNKKYVLYPHGIDRVEYLLSANKGEELRELKRVASGGEMSRIMLAIKKVILSFDLVESLVFDEVDAGIGGKIAQIVGKKLKSLAANRQVLVVTHLPQIAAMSNLHLSVRKGNNNGRITTEIKKLNRDERIIEIARMLAGEKITDITMKHAEEMINLTNLE
ncbi:MAG: DNA repair protein RecN [Spirochaetota bacterium]|nr:DNA repair protein RecN [Spirochaetota bacterium]